MKYVFLNVNIKIIKIIKVYQFSKNEFFSRCFKYWAISNTFLELLEFFQQITKRIFETI